MFTSTLIKATSKTKQKQNKNKKGISNNTLETVTIT